MASFLINIIITVNKMYSFFRGRPTPQPDIPPRPATPTPYTQPRPTR